MRDIDGRPNGSCSGGRADTLIERHHDVAANRPLCLDAQLRAEKDRPSIEITLKDGARFAHRARMRQGKDLKSARVREYAAIPAHETVYATGAPKNFRTRSEQQMISVCEENLGAGFFECTSQLGLHSGLRADRHEERRLHFVVQSAKGRGPGPRIARQRVEAKIQARRHDTTASVFLLNPLRTLPARDDELCERRL